RGTGGGHVLRRVLLRAARPRHGGHGALSLAVPDRGPPDPADDPARLAVDLDQLFNTLSPKTIKDFKHVIEGFAQSYDGVSKQANEGLKYANPFLSTSRRVFAELNSDQRAFENL